MRKLLILIVLFECGVYCQNEVLKKNFLVIYDGDSNSFQQLSLDSNKTFLSRRKLPKENINKIIIENSKGFPTLHYIWSDSDSVGIHEIKSVDATDKKKQISREYIRDFDIDTSKDIYYYAAIDLFKHQENKSQELVKAKANSQISTLNFDPKTNLLYFLDCQGGIFLRRLDVQNNKELSSINLSQCVDRIFIDFEAQELFGIYGQVVYSKKLNSETPDMIKVFESNSKILGFAVGSKHLYYILEGHIFLYKFERNSNKEPKKFYEFLNGNLLALAISEDLATPKPSSAESLNLNIILLIMIFAFGFII